MANMTVHVIREDGTGTIRADDYPCDYVKAENGALEIAKKRYAGVAGSQTEWDHVISIPLQRVVEWRKTRR